jgi:hypothetical protein
MATSPEICLLNCAAADLLTFCILGYQERKAELRAFPQLSPADFLSGFVAVAGFPL